MLRREHYGDTEPSMAGGEESVGREARRGRAVRAGRGGDRTGAVISQRWLIGRWPRAARRLG